MVKIVVLIGQRPDMTVEEFRRYHREKHLPLVRQLPGLRRIVVNYPVADASGTEPAYDAIVEDWFDSPEALEAANASEQMQAVYEDAPNFLDTARLSVFAVDETVLVG